MSIYLIVSYLIALYLFCRPSKNNGFGHSNKMTIGLFLAPISVPIILLVKLLRHTRRL